MAAIVLVVGFSLWWIFPGAARPVADISRYKEFRRLITERVGNEAIACVPSTIPQNAQEPQMWARASSDKIGATLMLMCRFTPDEAKRIAAEARPRAVQPRSPTEGKQPRFYEPGWQNIVPGAAPGRDLPASLEKILLYKDSLGTSTDEINAGILVDQEKGIVVWWAQHRHVAFN